MEKEKAMEEWEEYCQEIESRTFSSKDSETLLSTLDELRETVKTNYALSCGGQETFPVPKIEIGDYEVKQHAEYLDTEEDGIVDFSYFLGAKNKETGQVIHLKDKYDDQLLLEHLKEKERNIFQNIIYAAKKMAFTYDIPIASELLCRDKKFTLEMMKSDPTSIFHISDKLRNDKEFMLEAIKLDSGNINKISKELSNDKEFIQEALKLKSRMSSIPNEIFKKELKEIYQDLSHGEKQKEILQTVNPLEKTLEKNRDKGLGR